METSNVVAKSDEQRVLTKDQCCVLPEIVRQALEEDIRSGRMHFEVFDPELFIELDETFRWIKARHGVTAPFNWKPLRKDGRKVNPFTDDLMIAPLSLSAVVI